MGDFTMPSLGADMESGKVTHWLVKPGDEVKRGDIVAVVQTEKSEIEVEIFEDGTVEELVVAEGSQVPVGAVLAHIATRGPAKAPGERRSVPPVAREPATGHEVRAASRHVQGATSHGPLVESPIVRHLAERLGVSLESLSGSGLGGVVTRADVERAANTSAARAGQLGSRRPASSPFARRLAGELGVDLAQVTGTGPGGSVIERDVRRAGLTAASEVRGTPEATSHDRQRAMQRAVGALMARSKREVPHYYLRETIDLSTSAAWLEQANLERPVEDRLVMAALLFSATARAVKRVPEVNGFYVDGSFVPSASVHLGIAISQRSGGLIAPAIHDADQLGLTELMRQMKELVIRAREGILRSSEMSDPTITVTNLGDRGVESVLGVIYPPQVALVGFGRESEQPWAANGVVDVRRCVVATLSGDHRVSDGIRGARFLREIDRLLQEPEKL